MLLTEYIFNQIMTKWAQALVRALVLQGQQ